MNYLETLLEVARSDKNHEIVRESIVGTYEVTESMVIRAFENGEFNPSEYAIANDKGQIIFRCEEAIADLKADYADMI